MIELFILAVAVAQLLLAVPILLAAFKSLFDDESDVVQFSLLQVRPTDE